MAPCNASCANCPTRLRVEASVHDPSNNRSIFAGASPPVHLTIPAEVAITNTSNQRFTNTLDVTYDSRKDAYVGTLDLGSGIANGSYTVAVKFRDRVRTLPKQVPGFITLQKGSTAVAQAILTPGDINKDDKVNILDYNILLGCYGPNPSSCDADSRKGSDLNDDGAVNEFDYNLLLRVLGNVGGVQTTSNQINSRNRGNARGNKRRKKR